MEYTWRQFDEDVGKIINWVSENKLDLDGVYGIPKGGLVLAVKLCNSFNLPLLLRKEEITEKTLVVDDIADTGKTLEPFCRNGNKTVTLYFHKQTRVMPDYCLREKIGDDWVDFPWDNSGKKYRDGTKIV